DRPSLRVAQEPRIGLDAQDSSATLDESARLIPDARAQVEDELTRSQWSRGKQRGPMAPVELRLVLVSKGHRAPQRCAGVRANVRASVRARVIRIEKWLGPSQDKFASVEVH